VKSSEYRHVNENWEDHMRPSLRKILKIMTGVILLMLAGCSDSSMDTVSEDPVADQPGFAGKVAGAVSGEITGPGVATYLPPQNTIDGVRPGYYLLANTRSVKDFLITFRVPAETQPGTFPLEVADPMKLGENFEVRVESRMDGQLAAYGSNASGTLTLETFPVDGNRLAGANFKGAFEFAIEGTEGERLSATGTFEFLG
jgi:hypothetical protein